MKRLTKRHLSLRGEKWDGVIIPVAIQYVKGFFSPHKAHLLPKCYLILCIKSEGFISMTKIKKISRKVADLGGLVTSCGFFGPDVASQDTGCG